MKLRTMLVSALLLLGVFVLWRLRLKQWKETQIRSQVTGSFVQLDEKQQPRSLTLLYRPLKLGGKALSESFSLQGTPKRRWKSMRVPYNFLTQRPDHLLASQGKVLQLLSSKGRYRLEALSQETGKTMWSTELPGDLEPAVFSPLFVQGNRLVVIMREQRSLLKMKHLVMALQVETGQILWKYSLWLPTSRHPRVANGNILFPGTRQMQVLELKTGTYSKWAVTGPPLHCGGRWFHFRQTPGNPPVWWRVPFWQIHPTRITKTSASSRPTSQRLLSWSSKDFSPYALQGCFQQWFWFPTLSSKGNRLSWVHMTTKATATTAFQDGFQLLPYTRRWASSKLALRNPRVRYIPLVLRKGTSPSMEQRVVLLDLKQRAVIWRSRPQKRNSSTLYNDQWRLHKGHFFGLLPAGKTVDDRVLVVFSGLTGKLVAAWNWHQTTRKQQVFASFPEKVWQTSQLTGDWWGGHWQERNWVVNWKTGRFLWRKGFALSQWKLVDARSRLKKLWGLQ